MADKNLEDFRSGIKDVQRGSTVIDASPKAVTITAVDTDFTFIIISWNTTAANTRESVNYYLTNTTTLTLTSDLAASAQTVKWQVIEFQSQYFGAIIKNIQRGTVTLDSATPSKTVTITAVVLAKSILNFGFIETQNDTRLFPNGEITNTTTLTFTTGINQNNGATVVNWEVVEFY